jgi:hypothetical protein
MEVWVATAKRSGGILRGGQGRSCKVPGVLEQGVVKALPHKVEVEE